jgi:hypothetical protein
MRCDQGNMQLRNAMCWFMDAIIFVTTLPSQTKMLEGRTNLSECVSRGSTFQGSEYSTWATIHHLTKLSRKIVASNKIHTSHATIFCNHLAAFMLPKTKMLDGRTNLSECVSRGSTYQGCDYRIWATKSRKMLRKDASSVSFSIPKSSFGSHKVVTRW